MDLLSLGQLAQSKPTVISPDSLVRSALHLLKNYHFKNLVVADEDKVLGLLTSDDALRFSIEQGNPDITTVSDIMSPAHPVLYSMPVSEAVTLMDEKQIRELVIVDRQGKPRGLVSQNDIFHALSKLRLEHDEINSIEGIQAYTWFLESLDLISKILSEQQHSPHMLKSLTNAIRDIFCVDRAWLIHPCNPEAEFHTIAVESSIESSDEEKQDGELTGKKLKADKETSELMRHALGSPRPIEYQVSDYTTPPKSWHEYSIKSQLVTALRPPTHSAWLLGIHQCSEERHWTPTEQRLFHSIAERVGLVLASRLLLQDINRREEQLREAEKIARLGRWELNIRTGQANWSQEIHNIFGTSKNQKVGPEFLRTRTHPEDWPALEYSLQQAIVTGSPHEIEYRIRNTEGKERWLLCKAERVLDSKQQPLKLTGIAQDITDRILAEQKLLQAGAEWTQAMDQLDSPVYMLNLQHKLVRANKAFFTMVKRPPEDCIGSAIRELMHPDGDSKNCPIGQALKKPHDSIITLEANQAHNPTGNAVEATIKCLKDSAGDPSGHLVTLHDLSHARKTEERLRLAANVFDNTDEGIVMTDTEGTVVEVNRAFEEILGYSRDEIIGQNARLWKSGRHCQEFYRDMWKSLDEHGVWRGEIWNRRKDGGIWPSWQTISAVVNKEGELTHYVSVISDISHIKQSQEKLDHLAHHDALTDLPNRLLLNERLEQAIKHAKRKNGQFAVIFLDLDHFKHINDSMGHPVGDELLQNIAKMLVEAVREDDTVARIGGDEFVLLLHDIEHVEDAGVVAQKLVTAVSQPLTLKQREIAVSASMGVCLYPRDGLEVTTLLRNADSAMYRAKAEGRNTYQYYTKELTHNAFERVLLENSLRQAINKDELRLFYQPQLDINTNRVIGVEALVRWQHAQFGMISPDKFIPLAEESGLILSIGSWVLRTACLQARDWLNRSIPFNRISVNISGIQLQRTGLVEEVKRELKSSGLPAKYLELEITESSIMKPAGLAFDQLLELQQMGVSLAIDDFGTGYSSLSHLKKLPINRLKIDRSFISDIPTDTNDVAIANAVIALARSLDLSVIAEGVETLEQVEFLKNAGCYEGQGFLYSKPVDSKTAETVLSDLAEPNAFASEEISPMCAEMA